MIALSIVVHDAEEGVRVSTEIELDRVIHTACEEARAQRILNIISLEAANGNALSMVVGGDDTVVLFIHGHRNPLYHASSGAQASTHPLMTCYVGLVHHTEFPRKYVIPFEKGLIAAHEFAESEELPQSIEWTAPFHVLPRGFAGPSLLAMILFEKYGHHQPLNRQSERYAREGIELSLSTLADQVGGCVALLRPLHDLIRAHVLAGERVHGDETPVPVLAKGQTATGRAWVYVRDDRPFGGPDPPAAVFFYSRDRAGEHAERHLHGYGGILQADCYAGFNRLYEAGRNGGPITEAVCWAHARRKFFVLADVTAKARGTLAVIAPMAFEAVKRVDAIFDVEREINGRPPLERLAERALHVAPLVADLETWMRTERAKLLRHSDVAKAMDYMLKRWEAFARFLSDGHICLTNNAAERALRGIALGRKAWLFAGSDRGGERAAVMYTLIQTAKLNDVDPQAWLADVLARINDHNIQTLDQLLPWNWKLSAQKLVD